ncbi:type I glyceraldehyde-3-phosphate dehydrogenase [bacterium (Candidatus Moisslbacteria) CG12_big_fil_rev_8_21_14_0_65_36_11]|nr:type I glyceraldehyde-3-phosphate dehydrogenase [Candidatus Kuenenbacteria bacterium]OIP76238.1 MAG: type I glyceraldehyde-3-phosphate dehydrogenase [Parcubacteria group bacterium CG2_30_36_38]PIV46242.1 MAG: type I glyceraldehyde-3-phosphate dehydrogenase [bacterium (Candidatus Moisslbacteria) CG02_land_8_20_14_3_00_36_53]PIW67930.1 MAG: type I glyceraldehyde-3-phosphate dehydrogenase [bacterium (Candidatus Moisslbacteria) CG12_big_fil_rev_8_21_14_0_65_36_11]PIZ90232.1 MAG: type I glycerald
MKKIRVAINGFGRIGRPTFRIALEKPELEIVAINDLTDSKALAHLLQYDSLYGRYKKEVKWTNDSLIVDGKKIKVYAESEPNKLPWKELGVDIVLESSGHFTGKKGASLHLEAGAKRVIISAPVKGDDIPTYILGVNEEKLSSNEKIISNGSCTTNCLAPVAKILNDEFEIEEGFMTTIHSYTNDQRILDLPHKDLRRARAAACNIIPTTTGATQSVVAAIPSLKGKLDGLAIRVPTPVVSVIDFVARVMRKTSKEEINNVFTKQSEGRLKNILAVTSDPLVSSDFIGDSHSAIIDLSLTQVNDHLVKVIAWYDNEWGYANRYVEMAEYLGKLI